MHGHGCGCCCGGESMDQQISSSLDSKQGIGGPTKVLASWRMLGRHGWSICFVMPWTKNDDTHTTSTEVELIGGSSKIFHLKQHDMLLSR